MDITKWIEKKQSELRTVGSELIGLDFERIQNLGNIVVRALNNGNKVAFLGNGGSAAEAMHLAAEFISKCSVDHKPLNSVCLNESQSSITAIGNDYGFEFVFERLVQAEIKRGDILIALSTSGKSKNILNAIKSAVEIGAFVVLWTGSDVKKMTDVEVWNCMILATPRVQEIHLVWGHLLAEYVELHFLTK
jgi:D-sedoheptulose 7-phosphate isomerase